MTDNCASCPLSIHCVVSIETTRRHIEEARERLVGCAADAALDEADRTDLVRAYDAVIERAESRFVGDPEGFSRVLMAFGDLMDKTLATAERTSLRRATFGEIVMLQLERDLARLAGYEAFTRAQEQCSGPSERWRGWLRKRWSSECNSPAESEVVRFVQETERTNARYLAAYRNGMPPAELNRRMAHGEFGP